MKSIIVLSDTRLPTRADGGHGLGMSAHSIATGLAARGYHVMLAAGHGSEFDAGPLFEFSSESQMAMWARSQYNTAVFLDTGHHHKLSQFDKRLPVLNRICDRECNYVPPNAVVNSRYMQRMYAGAQLINTGIDDPDRFSHDHDGYLLFASNKNDIEMGYHDAQTVAKHVGLPLKVANGLSGNVKWEMYSRAFALLYPSQNRAAPRLPIEVGYCGVPTICFDKDGASHTIEHGFTGYACKDINDMVRALKAIQLPSYRVHRKYIYSYMLANHSYEKMIDGYEKALMQVAENGRIEVPA